MGPQVDKFLFVKHNKIKECNNNSGFYAHDNHDYNGIDNNDDNSNDHNNNGAHTCQAG